MRCLKSFMAAAAFVAVMALAPFHARAQDVSSTGYYPGTTVTLTPSQRSALILDSHGNLNVTVAGGAITPSGIQQVGPTAAANTPTNPFVVSEGVKITPTACAFSAVATAATPVNAIAANTIIHGARITNPTGSPMLFVNVVSAAATTEGGTTIGIPAGTTWPAPGASTLAISVNAAAPQPFDCFIY